MRTAPFQFSSPEILLLLSALEESKGKQLFFGTTAYQIKTRLEIGLKNLAMNVENDSSTERAAI